MDIKELQTKRPKHKWKPQNYNQDKTKAGCVAYIDARDVMDILDEVVGQLGWKDEYRETVSGVVCRLSLYSDLTKEWIHKEDKGMETDVESEKGAYSDAFKRAAVKWGIGRFLYSMDTEWVDWNFKAKRAHDGTGKLIYDLTKFIEERKNGKSGVTLEQVNAMQPNAPANTMTWDDCACGKRKRANYPNCYACNKK